MSDFTTAFLKYYLTNPLIISILVLGLISAIFYKQIIGWFGEHWTKKALSKLPKTKYKIINNLLLSVNGLTHQIDHVIISQYGGPDGELAASLRYLSQRFGMPDQKAKAILNDIGTEE